MRFLSRFRISTTPVNFAGAILLFAYGLLLCNFTGLIDGAFAGPNMMISLIMIVCLAVLIYVLTHRGSRGITVVALLDGAAICGLLVYGFLTYGAGFFWFLIWPVLLAGMVIVLLGLLYMTLKR